MKSRRFPSGGAQRSILNGAAELNLDQTMRFASLCSRSDMDALDVQGIAFESLGSFLAQSVRRIVPTARRLLPAAS